MELRLRLLGVNRSIDLSRFTPYRNAIVVLASALLAIPLTVLLLRPAAVPDLAHGNVEGARALLAGWARGDMIVLVRHVERCDHSSAPSTLPWARSGTAAGRSSSTVKGIASNAEASTTIALR